MEQPYDASQGFCSVLDLATGAGPIVRELQSWFDVTALPAERIVFGSAGWAAAKLILDSPRHVVEDQTIVLIKDRQLGAEALFNPLRGRRSVRPSMPSSLAAPGVCPWCSSDQWHVSRSDLWRDGFGDVVSADGRFRAGPNWARQAPISGLAWGDETVHDLATLCSDDFISLFAMADRYRHLASAAWPQIPFFTLFMNGGPRSGGSVDHAHVQIVAFPHAPPPSLQRVVALGASAYWQGLAEIHAILGLSLATCSGCTAWLNLCPVKERDVTIVCDSVVEGAAAAYRAIRALEMTNFSLLAFPRPFGAAGSAMADWPGVIWRLVDRGDPAVRHADIGTMEILGSVSVIASDPFVEAALLRL